jgi:hypothetical protein
MSMLMPISQSDSNVLKAKAEAEAVVEHAA